MRAVFSIVGVLAVVAVVGALARQQLGAARPVPTAVAGSAPAPAATPQQRAQQVQEAVQGVMQRPRPMPEDTR